MNRVEQGNRLVGLIRLQPADHVQADGRMPGPNRRPFGLSLLDAVFAEIALPGPDQRFDFVHGASLGDGDQADAGRLAPRNFAGRGNAIADSGQPGSGISRQNLKAVPT
jgi:hypothetical protein